MQALGDRLDMFVRVLGARLALRHNGRLQCRALGRTKAGSGAKPVGGGGLGEGYGGGLGGFEESEFTRDISEEDEDAPKYTMVDAPFVPDYVTDPKFLERRLG